MSNYFDFTEADPRDKQLVLAKEMRIVPEGCLLNGSLVMGLHYTAPIDKDDTYICKMCKDGPREKCSGAAYEPTKAPAGELQGKDSHLTVTDDAGFRALERKRIIAKLDDL
jgi:hypothetical protein